MRFRQIAAGVISLSVFLIGSSLRAAPIIEETFTGYLDNALISDSPAGPATGLTGDWRLVPDSNFYVNKTATDNDAGTGKAVYDRPAGDNGTREATRATSVDHLLFASDGDLFYASFLIDPALANGRMTFELVLTRLDGGGTPALSFGIIDGQYAVGNGGIDVDVSGGSVIADEHLVLVRIEYGDADSGPDDSEVVTMWVDPVDESSTPVINGVSTDFLNRGGGRITAVSIRGEQMIGQPAFFDDLRVGSSFDAVIPNPNATPTPTPGATPTPAATPNPPLPISGEIETKIQLRFNKVSKDKIKVKIKNWTLPVGLVPTDVTVNVGGAEFTGTLDANGKFKSLDKRDTIVMKQSGKTQLWKLTVKRKDNEFAADLADEGLTDADNPKPGLPVTVPVTIEVGGVMYGQGMSLLYRSKLGKKGTAK